MNCSNSSVPPQSLWKQLGDDIVGEAYYDLSGISMSLSRDGSIVAIGASANKGNGYYAGHARIYEYDSSTKIWSQLGQDIDGELAGDRAGNSLSLSSDGSIVAISSYKHDSQKGHVRVFQYSRSANIWTRLGQDIDGENTFDQSGFSVSLSSDGTVVAIGAKLNDGNADNAGHVRIYQYNANSWDQIGDDIDGSYYDDEFGFSVSLSSTGTRVAIGAPENDAIGRTKLGSGHVRVYQYDGSVWNQLGQDIQGESEKDYSGKAVSLSSDGSIVAIGAGSNDGNGDRAGHVRVYNCNSGTNLWTQRGDDIDGGGDDYFFGEKSVSLSADGSILAVGAIGAGVAYDGAAYVYEYNSGSDSWSQLGETIEGDYYNYAGHEVALSADGYTLAVSAVGSNFLTGAVSVYNADLTQL